MPFITEEIYQENFKKFENEESIHLSKWPESEKIGNSEKWNKLLELISKIRQEKSQVGKAMNSEIKLILEKKDFIEFEEFLNDLKDVVNAKEIKEGKKFWVEFI